MLDREGEVGYIGHSLLVIWVSGKRCHFFYNLSRIGYVGGKILISIILRHYAEYFWFVQFFDRLGRKTPPTYELGAYDKLQNRSVRSFEQALPMMAEESPIRGLHVFSTGIGSIHTEHRYGTRLPQMWWVLFSRNWVEVPINVFVLEHPQGLVLFDAGLDTAALTDPNYVDSAIGRFFMRRLFRIMMRPDETLSNKLAGLGLDAGDVCKVVVSHLHFDHVGGIAEVPQADLLVSRDEWAQLSEPHPERDFIFREHVQHPGARWQLVDFEHTDDPLLTPFGGCHDVMNDGSLILLPTPGHTPGSMSMLARINGRAPVLLIGDLAYEAELLMKDQLPDTGDKAQLLASYAKVRGLKQRLPELVILPSHDFAAQKYLSSVAQQDAPADRSTAVRFSVG